MTHARAIGAAFVAALVLFSGAGVAVAATDAGFATQDNETDNETADANETVDNETATVTFENQTSNGTAVVANNTSLPEGGFVVIHAAEAIDGDNVTDNENESNMIGQENITENVTGDNATDEQEYEAGEVLGNSTYLESGEHENVTIEFDEPIEESQVLIAMPHQDTNDNQEYEFPEADNPYMDNGEPVTDDAMITLEEMGEELNETANNETEA